MQQVTAAQKTEIANIMFEETAKYINIYCINNQDTVGTQMYCGDIIHNIQTLSK